MAGAMEKIKAKVENVLHKDKDTTHDTTHTGTTGTHTTGSGLTSSTHNDPTGPHSSHTANQADPRVDSDRLGTAGNTAGAGGVGAGQYGSTGTHGTTGSGLTGSHTTHGNDPTGPHSSHLANQADPRVDSDRYGTAGNTSGAGGVGAGQYGSTGTHGTTGHSTTHGSDPTGPHDSKLANKLDPRVDSDRVGPAGNSSSVGGYGNEHHTSGQQTYQTDGKKLPDALLEDKSRADQHQGAGLTHSSHTNTGSGLTGSNTHSSNTHGSDPTGPHNSHLANKADPRVDSDRYGTAGNTAGAGGVGAGQYGTTGTHGTHGDYSSTGSGLTGTHGTHTGSGLTGGAPHTGSHTGSHLGSDPTGPHNTHLANQADPRVDSDRYGAAGNTAGAGGYGAGQYGNTGTHTGSGLTGNHGHSDPSGPHDSRLANQADPRVDSDRYGGQGNTYGTHQSSGLTGTNHPGHVGNNKADQTAGPHGSNVLNKLDPRVDSDLDGSKTTGGDRTYG